MDKDRINLFVSHSGKDENMIEPFKKLIGHKYYVRDSSIKESNPNRATDEKYIKYNILAPKIDWAGVVVVLVGPRTHERDYVNWEIEYAQRHNKKIIGVYLPGAEDSDIPEALEKYGDSLVTWDEKKVIKALDGNIAWEDSKGTTRKSAMERGEC